MAATVATLDPHTKANIAQAGRGDAELAESAKEFWGLVKAGLQIEQLTRVGHRTFIVYETSSPQEAIKSAAGLTAFDFKEGVDLGAPLYDRQLEELKRTRRERLVPLPLPQAVAVR